MEYKQALLPSVLLGVLASGVHAEEFGSLPARSMDPAENQEPSVEGFYRQESDFSGFGARLNFRLNDSVLLYGDFIKAEVDDDDLPDLEGDGFGGGFFYYLPQYSTDYFVAFRASYHSVDLESKEDFGVNTNVGTLRSQLELAATSISGQIMLSAKEPISDNGLRWFAGLGIARTEFEPDLTSGNTTITGLVEDDTETDPLLSLGVFLPLSSGEAYAGLDHRDDTILGVGFRFYL